MAAPEELRAVSREVQPLSAHLGALGMTGMTAWAGMLAKLRGCRVIGSAGSPGKVAFLRDECGFDRAFNYKAGSVVDQLKLAAPDGIDVYFDNVGGETLEAALAALRVHGRIIACGGISGYNAANPRPGQSFQHDHQAAHDEVAAGARLTGSAGRIRT